MRLCGYCEKPFDEEYWRGEGEEKCIHCGEFLDNPPYLIERRRKPKNKFILDACCGVKAMWKNKNHPNTIYIDIRKKPSGFLGYGRKEAINPTHQMDFTNIEFPDKSFKLVVFEPPHLSKLGKTSYFRNKFGALNPLTWKRDLKDGFNECWRVLDEYGVLEFKWSDSEIPFKEVLSLFDEEPLFYNITNYKATSKTKWFCFMKIPKEETHS